MKQHLYTSIKSLLSIILITAGCFLSSSCNKEHKTNPTREFNTYYIHAETGNDKHDGTTKKTAWKSIQQLKTVDLQAGDRVLLASGSTFKEPLELYRLEGSKEQPIRISSYNPTGTDNEDKAIIEVTNSLNGILIEDCSYLEIKNLKVSANAASNAIQNTEKAMRCGVLIKPKQNGTTQHIVLDNMLIKDVFYEKPGVERSAGEVHSANGTQNYGWGIRVINSNVNAIIKDITISNCHIENVSHTGIKFTGKNRSIQNIVVQDCKVIRTGGPGIQMSGVVKGQIRNNYVNKSGSDDDSRKWGRGSGLWTWGSADILIEKNHFLNANGPGDSAGAHIDFNCENIVLQYNFSANNAGGFCEILGNNYNCAYRYNISVNDGYRVKGENGAFQEGKTLWLSGFCGKGKERKGPFNSYIYNNTICVSENIISKMAFDKAASGVLIMNNIFYIEGTTTGVLGDQYKPEEAGTSNITNLIFENNLFLKAGNWPNSIAIEDNSPRYGNPQFKNVLGNTISDFIPENSALIKNKGIEIPTIPTDTIGLTLGLKVTHDILGNPITNSPGLGAIATK